PTTRGAYHTTSNIYQKGPNSPTDGSAVCVTKLNATGGDLSYWTFGGGGTDYGYGIALDAAGNAYVGGQTGSSNFPTTAGAYQRTAGSGFALEIDPPADASEVSTPLPTPG